MLSKYNYIDVQSILEQEKAAPPFPPASNRDAWNKVCADLGEEKVARYIANGEACARMDIPALSATLYLDFKRTGERLPYENPVAKRRSMLRCLTLAECLEYEGRFLDPLLNLVWAICEESSWSYPAHQTELTDMTKPVIDLFATMTGRQLAEFDLLLGAELDDWVGHRIRYEVNRRLFEPYLTPHRPWWWMYNTRDRRTNNWNAVCNGNIVSAAILLEDDNARLAEIIARAARSLDDYLETFDADGGSTEGPGYWSYGYGNYVLMAQLVEQRSNGQLEFLGSDQIRKISQFPARTVLSHNLFVNFSDCDMHVSLQPALLAFLSKRLDLPELMALARQQPSDEADRVVHEILPWGLREIFWSVEPDAAPFVPNQHDWYEEMMWMIARYDPQNPDALVLAAKGGHNEEMHNQNDVGNIIVHVNGESIIADIGRGRYTKAYFTQSLRYDHFVCQSLGHSLPVPNGQQQGAGREYAAALLDHHADDAQDMMSIELKGAYPPEADLQSLVRTVTLHREAPDGWVELVDDFAYASGAHPFESMLTTFGDVRIEADSVHVQGEKGALQIKYDANTVAFRIQKVEKVDLAEGEKDVNLIVFSPIDEQQSGKVRLAFYPDSHK
ncbi:MAG: heparinase II/III family protein [Anaerolineaceae bacterium]|nr:heparinase II/III family protein [Anaerolineaceae bacterium]